MTQEIQGIGIDVYHDGMRHLMSAAAPGTAKVLTKDGSVDVPFAAGELLLADDHGRVIVGPVSVSGAVDLAERVLDGDMRAITDPLTIFALATAIAGFRLELDPCEPDPVDPAVAALDVTGA